jgi:hypothetical protein
MMMLLLLLLLLLIGDVERKPRTGMSFGNKALSKVTYASGAKTCAED